MNTYYLRCVDSDLPRLLALGHALGALQTFEDVVSATGGGCWDVLGTLPDPATAQTGGFEMPVVYADILRDAEGAPYFHANLRTPINLRDAAEALAATNPAIAGALASIPRFFVSDDLGAATSPANPARVFL